MRTEPSWTWPCVHGTKRSRLREDVGGIRGETQDLRCGHWVFSLPSIPNARFLMWTLLRHARRWWRSTPAQRISAEGAWRRVRRGAAYLDEVDPGWYQRIDAATLSLSSGRHCVLGQLHGEFRLGLGRSHIVSLSSAPRASLSPVAYGFKCVGDVSAAEQARDYELLTAAWRLVIGERQATSEQQVEESSERIRASSRDRRSRASRPHAPASVTE